MIAARLFYIIYIGGFFGTMIIIASQLLFGKKVSFKNILRLMVLSVLWPIALFTKSGNNFLKQTIEEGTK